LIDFASGCDLSQEQLVQKKNNFQLCLEYTIKKLQENQVGLKLNGTHQLLVYADDVILLGDNIDTIKKNTNYNRC
jgi:hypothetical protein